MSFLRLSCWLTLPLFIAGCYSTSEITVDYPLDPTTVAAINRGGGRATLVMADSQVVATSRLNVDSVMARWLDGEWKAAPLVNVRSITFIDPDQYMSQTVKGAMWGGAVFGTIGLVSGLSENQSAGEVIGGTLAFAGVGAVLAVLTHEKLWSPLADPQLRYSIRPPQNVEESARRDADRMRVESEVRAMIPELNRRNRVGRIEAGMTYGRENPVNAESDASDPRVIGGMMSFGIRVWERLEMGLEFDYASHTFNRTHPDESVSNFSFTLTGTFFPLYDAGLFIRGGVGYGSYTASGTYTGAVVTTPLVTPASVTGGGFAMSIGAGYEIGLSDAFSLRPAIRYSVTPVGDLELNDKAVIATGKTSSLLTVSLSFVFRGVM